MTDVRRRMESAGDFILDHTKVAYLIWILLWFFLLDSLWTAAPLDDRTRFGALAWVTVAELLTTPLFVLRTTKVSLQSRELLVMSWLVAQVPLVFSAVAVLDRAPQWLTAVALVEVLALMFYSARRARPKDGLDG